MPVHEGRLRAIALPAVTPVAPGSSLGGGLGFGPNPQDLHEALIAGAQDAIVIRTIHGIVISWNRAATEIFGYAEHEIIGTSAEFLIPDDRLEAQSGTFEKVGNGERINNYQTIRRRKDGDLINASITVSPIRDRNGTIIGISEIVRDISEYLKGAKALRLAEERDALVLAGMSVGVWDWDVVTGKMFGSAHLQSIMGAASPDAADTYEKFAARLHPDDREAMAGALQAHLERREKFDIMYRVWVKSDHYAWIHATGQAVWDAHGAPIRMAGSIEDVTQRNKLENELVAMVDKLKKSNKDLDEFAYAASHDLKAPLRVIDNTSQWLLEDLEPYLNQETRENMNLLRSRVKRMEKLLGDLLEYSRIGRTQDERFAEVVKGGELLENILELLSPNAGFTVQAAAGFSAMTVMRMPLQQVLMNLIGNAIKHHDKTEGTVKLGMEDAGPMIEFLVEDDGPGISAQFHDKVFEMFRTLKPRDHVEGSGMGLAMVRKNVEMVGGTITLQSSPGQGSRFRFTWPKTQPDLVPA